MEDTPTDTSPEGKSIDVIHYEGRLVDFRAAGGDDYNTFHMFLIFDDGEVFYFFGDLNTPTFTLPSDVVVVQRGYQEYYIFERDEYTRYSEGFD